MIARIIESVENRIYNFVAPHLPDQILASEYAIGLLKQENEALREAGYLYLAEMKRLRSEMKDYSAQNSALLDCYLVLDKISLRDDSSSSELSRLAYEVIKKHEIYRTTKESKNG